MSFKRPASPEQVLAAANGKGEIGYVAGGEDRDWPAMQELIDRGRIRFKQDRSYRDVASGEWRSRLIYEVV